MQISHILLVTVSSQYHDSRKGAFFQRLLGITNVLSTVRRVHLCPLVKIVIEDRKSKYDFFFFLADFNFQFD